MLKPVVVGMFVIVAGAAAVGFIEDQNFNMGTSCDGQPTSASGWLVDVCQMFYNASAASTTPIGSQKTRMDDESNFAVLTYFESTTCEGQYQPFPMSIYSDCVVKSNLQGDYLGNRVYEQSDKPPYDSYPFGVVTKSFDTIENCDKDGDASYYWTAFGVCFPFEVANNTEIVAAKYTSTVVSNPNTPLGYYTVDVYTDDLCEAYVQELTLPFDTCTPIDKSSQPPPPMTSNYKTSGCTGQH